jgi:hydrogenase expression/formation protein HypC
MCLAIPGRIIEITGDDPVMRTGRVSFGGIIREVNLAFVPEASVGMYVLVHAGVAITAIDEEEAAQTFEYLRQIDQAGSSEGSGDEIH